MRSYTLSVLSSLNTSNAKVEIEIIKWVNEKLTASGKADSKINSFQDSKIATARPIIDLIDAIKPGVINYELLQENGGTYEEDLANAKYALSMARRIGARVYALPEDIVEIKHKMVMTVFACLMSKDYVPNMDSKKKLNGNGSTDELLAETDEALLVSASSSVS